MAVREFFPPVPGGILVDAFGEVPGGFREEEGRPVRVREALPQVDRAGVLCKPRHLSEDGLAECGHPRY